MEAIEVADDALLDLLEQLRENVSRRSAKENFDGKQDRDARDALAVFEARYLCRALYAKKRCELLLRECPLSAMCTQILRKGVLH